MNEAQHLNIFGLNCFVLRQFHLPKDVMEYTVYAHHCVIGTRMRFDLDIPVDQFAEHVGADTLIGSPLTDYEVNIIKDHVGEELAFNSLIWHQLDGPGWMRLEWNVPDGALEKFVEKLDGPREKCYFLHESEYPPREGKYNFHSDEEIREVRGL